MPGHQPGPSPTALVTHTLHSVQLPVCPSAQKPRNKPCLPHLAEAPPPPCLGWFGAHPEPCPSLLVSASASETMGTCMGQAPPSPQHWILRADPMKPRVLWLLGAGGISQAWEGSQGRRGAPVSPGLLPLQFTGSRLSQSPTDTETGRERQRGRAWEGG